MVKFTYQSLKRLQVSKGFSKVSQGKRLLKFSKGISAYVSKGLSKCFKRCQAGFWNTDFLEHRFFGKPVFVWENRFLIDRFFGKPLLDNFFFESCLFGNRFQGKPFHGQLIFGNFFWRGKPHFVRRETPNGLKLLG